MKYLNPVNRKRRHFVVSHILADDGKTALCVHHPGIQAWPQVTPGDWEIGDEKKDGYVCSRCVERKLKMETPLASAPGRKNRRLERDLARLAKWNEAAHVSTL